MISLEEKKQSIAWFRLHEAFLKNENERAFILYRLISHSIDDNGLKLLALGDLYLYFEKQEEALNKYKESFNIFINNKNTYGSCIALSRIKYFIKEKEEINKFIKEIPELDTKKEFKFFISTIKE